MFLWGTSEFAVVLFAASCLSCQWPNQHGLMLDVDLCPLRSCSPTLACCTLPLVSHDVQRLWWQVAFTVSLAALVLEWCCVSLFATTLANTMLW